MKPLIKEIDAFSVLGVQARINQGSETLEFFTRIWEQFESYSKVIEPLSIDKQYFGIRFPTDSETVTEYMAGMRIANESSAPDGLMKRVVPSGEYALFECSIEGIGECYQYIFTKWLLSAPVAFNPKNPVFEKYPEKGSTRPVGIHIPVIKHEKQ